MSVSSYPAIYSPEFAEAFASFVKEMGWEGHIQLPTSNDNVPCAFVDKLRMAIPNFAYLESRGWFHRDDVLQDKLMWAVDLGLGSRIIVTHPDGLHTHLDELCAEAVEKLRVDELDKVAE